ncbi:hypothetical protein WA026_017318, partial [Henosepilachna vigintioctopunctata]
MKTIKFKVIISSPSVSLISSLGRYLDRCRALLPKRFCVDAKEKVKTKDINCSATVKQFFISIYSAW